MSHDYNKRKPNDCNENCDVVDKNKKRLMNTTMLTTILTKLRSESAADHEIGASSFDGTVGGNGADGEDGQSQHQVRYEQNK